MAKSTKKLRRRCPIISNRGAPVPKSSPRGLGTTPKPVVKVTFHPTGVQRLPAEAAYAKNNNDSERVTNTNPGPHCRPTLANSTRPATCQNSTPPIDPIYTPSTARRGSSRRIRRCFLPLARFAAQKYHLREGKQVRSLPSPRGFTVFSPRAPRKAYPPSRFSRPTTLFLSLEMDAYQPSQ